MKKNIRNILVIVLALCVCAVIGFKAGDSRLKADEAAPETQVVEAAPDAVVERAAEPAPAEEPELTIAEVEVEIPLEEPAAEEPAEALPEEQISEEAEAAEEPVEEAPVEKSIRTWFEYEGEPRLGMTVVIRSAISGYSDNVAYKWQYTTNGVNWQDAPNGTSASYTFVLDETTCNYKWRLGVYDYEPVVEASAEPAAE